MPDTGAVSVPSYKRHRFPPEVIAHAVWLYYRFALSFRDIEEMLASRGVVLQIGMWALNNIRQRAAPDAWFLSRQVYE
jgi:hypothetical protein